MRYEERKVWPVLLLESLIYRIAFFLSLWLKKKARHRWEKLVIRVDRNEGQRVGLPSEMSYNSIKSMRPESFIQKGYSGDTQRQNIGSVSLPNWAKEIQPFLQNQLSDHTRRAYETDLKHFFLFLEGRIDPVTLDCLRPQHIILYRKFLEEGRMTGTPMEKSTINRKLAVVKSFLNWLKLNQIISDNPAHLVKGFPQSQESSLKGLSDEEVRKILTYPRKNSRAGALHLAILHTLLYLGLRKGELIGLKVGDLDEERGISVVKVRGKGHRVRILPVTPSVKANLQHYFEVCKRDLSDKEAPLFIPTKNPRTHTLRKAINPNAITYIVQRYAKMAGILKPISPHSCRATCISNALDRRATHRSVQHLAGWSTPLMIQRYDKRREDLKNSAAYAVDYGDEPVAGSA